MKPIRTFVKLMSEGELGALYESALKVLEDPGMRIGAGGLRSALKRQGAAVADGNEVVRFPRALIEETLRHAAAEEAERRARCAGDVLQAEGALTFSWHTPFMATSPPLQASMGGGCPLFYEHTSGEVRYASVPDLVRMLHLAEALPEIVTAGNPVHCVLDEEGNAVPPALMPIVGAATIAKHSSKPGASAIMSPWQLDYLVAIGEVVRNGARGYRRRPVFINICDTTAPLQLSEPEGKVVEALAKRALPVYVVPMPLMGTTGPVTVFANATIGVAEILGTWAGAKAVNPAVPVECSVVSGVLEPRTGNPCFSGPEAIAIDLAVAQLLRSLGLRCGTGVGFIDAPLPGTAAAFERALKSTIAAMCGESTYPVGILGGGNIFSPEQVLLDLDIGGNHHHFLDSFDENDIAEAPQLIRERGIGGFFMDTLHTTAHFRDRIWLPRVFQRSKSKEPAHARDPVAAAHEQWQALLATCEPYRVPDGQAREIDKIVALARSRLDE